MGILLEYELYIYIYIVKQEGPAIIKIILAQTWSYLISFKYRITENNKRTIKCLNEHK